MHGNSRALNSDRIHRADAARIESDTALPRCCDGLVAQPPFSGKRGYARVQLACAVTWLVAWFADCRIGVGVPMTEF
jgi:hypothetical protein